MATIYLIRHGQASFGRRDYDQLSAKGMRQATQLGKALQSRLGQTPKLWCGPMKRHQQTATHFLQGFPKNPALSPKTLDGLAEIDHQDIIVRANPLYRSQLLMAVDLARTLKPNRAFQRFFEHALVRWVSGEFDDQYQETWPAFQQRCLSALEHIASETRTTSLVFTSAGPISTICQHLLGVPQENMLALNRSLVNCGVTKLVKGKQGLRLSTLNDHSFFENTGDLITYR